MSKWRLCSTHAYVFALDVKVMAEWLRDVLGFVGRLPNDWLVPYPYVNMRRDGLWLKVLNAQEMENKGADPNTRPRDYAFAVQGLRELRSDLEARQLRCSPIQQDGERMESFSTTDPENNTWKFWERQPKRSV